MLPEATVDGLFKAEAASTDFQLTIDLANQQVMTPDGEAKMTIPPGTPPGRSLRLRNKGWPGRSGRGDLLFSLVLDLPGQWSDEERRLLEQLRVQRSQDPRRSWLKSASL